ncbi:MAG: flagellar protein FlaG [Myxococcales bacterium]|nr:flagellar protein FlaG [Myxococcales bacterium]
MAINVSQALVGAGLRQTASKDAATARGSPRVRAEGPEDIEVPVADPVRVQPRSAAGSEGVAAAAEAAARAAEEVDPTALVRAVEEANVVAEAALRASHRSVEFRHDDSSGRITITIKEERNGEEVSKQIPPSQFLKMVERLRDMAERTRPRGALLELDV